MEILSDDKHHLQTRQRLYFGDARKMTAVGDGSVDLVVTSPPYPMIQMWDELFERLDPAVFRALEKNRGMAAFDGMHAALDRVWSEVHRVLRTGGIACINIGDAVRTIGGDFTLYPNHARILTAMLALGFQPLPTILWRKPTNAPNKFMGSGMLPPGAYVTLEHEHILVLRKGAKRDFSGSVEKHRRHESAYFWEERNTWFSDVWAGLIGANQRLAANDTRKRSAAFPLELPYRLISMFSVAGDRVLDPFLGIGTTLLAALATGRDAIGYELESEFRETIVQSLTAGVPIAQRRIAGRLADHVKFVQERTAAGRAIKHRNRFYGFPVMTRQEVDLVFHRPTAVSQPDKDLFVVDYELFHLQDGVVPPTAPPTDPDRASAASNRPRQGLLF